MPVTVPPVLKPYGVERDGQWFLPNLDMSRPTVLAYLPPEVYLRQFRDTPADDLDALEELCELGWIVQLHAHPYSDLPVNGDEAWKHSLAGEPVTPAWRDCENDLDAWRNFVGFTGAALRDFHVRVELETIERPQAPDESSLYSAAMLQLVNDLAANETIHTCANETCGRPFVRQLGRTTYGGHRRIGTLYCSSTCARAQYQREKRRRDRAAREERQG